METVFSAYAGVLRSDLRDIWGEGGTSALGITLVRVSVCSWHSTLEFEHIFSQKQTLHNDGSNKVVHRLIIRNRNLCVLTQEANAQL